MILYFGGNSTQTLLLQYNNQQTQPYVLHELQLLVRRMLIMVQRSITLLSSLISPLHRNGERVIV